MRIWKIAAGTDPAGVLNNLKPFADGGMRDELIAYYRAMQKQLPDSEFPARALKILEP